MVLSLDPEKVKQDLAFLDDQENAQSMRLGKIDKKFQQKMLKNLFQAFHDMVRYQSFVKQCRPLKTDEPGPDLEGDVLVKAISQTKYSIKRHEWYLETFIPFALCDEELSNSERESLAVTLKSK